MAKPSSKRVIHTALAANSLIAITKFAASAYTGSAAMLSEAVHSLVDTGNQGLLLYGIKRANRPPDAEHPFGYGMELYFWTFVVAMLIFGLGAAVSVFQGVDKLRHLQPITDAYINYIVLAVAMVFEAWAWWVAFREFRKSAGPRGLFEAVRRSKDPTVFTVLFEDTAAMLGLIAAFIGIALADHLNAPAFDGVASLVIGAILAVTAMLLAYECKGLLIGESARRPVVEGIERIVGAQTGILGINEVLTMHFGPDDVLLNLSLDFADELASSDVEAAISGLEMEIKESYPQITRIFIEAQSIAGHRASRGDGPA